MSGLSFDIFARDKASPAFDKVSRSVERTEKKFGFLSARTHGLTAGMTAGFGKVAGAMAAVGAAGFLKGAISDASDLGETISKSAAVFGPANADILKFGKSAATSLGQTQQQATAAASQFGNMFNQLGIGQKPAAQMSKQMVTLASDFASFHNADITEVLEAQNAAFRGEYDAVQKFVPTINAAAVEQEGLRLGLAGSTKELDAQDKAIATQSLLMKGAGKAVGDFARTSGGLANQQRILSAQFGDFKASLGQIALPLVTKFVTFINDHGIPALNTIKLGVEGLGAAFKGEGVTSDGFVGVMEHIGVTARRVFDVFTTVALPHLKDFGRFVSSKLVPSLGDFLGFITKWPGKVIAGLRTGFDTGDWGSLGKAIGGGLISALRGVGDTIDKVGSAIGDLVDRIDWGSLGSRIGNALRGVARNVDWGKVGDSLGDSVVTIFKRATTLGEKIGTAFKTLMDKVNWNQVGRDSTDAIGRFIAGIDWAKVSKTLGISVLKSLVLNKKIYDTVTGGIADLIKGMAESIGREIGHWFKGAGSWLSQKGKELVTGLTSGASEQAGGIGAWFSRNLIGPVVGAFTGSGKWLLRHGRNLITGLKDGVWDFAKGLDDWMTRAPVAKLMAPWHGAIKWLVGPGKNVISGLITGVGGAAKSVGTWIGRNVISPVVRAFTKSGSWLVQQGKNLVAGLQNGVVSIARGIGGWLTRNVVNPTVGAFTRAGSWLVQHGKNFVAGLKNGIGSVASSIGRWAYDRVIVPVVTPFGRAGSWLGRAGRDLIGGLIGGISTRMKGIGGWLKSNVVDPMVRAVKTFFGIKSPSTVFAGIGGHLVGGLLKGMGSGMGAAVAKKVFGDMPSALRSIVGKGLISVSNLPKKAMDALGSAVGFGDPIGGKPAPTSTGGNVGIVRTLAAQRGWGSGAQWNALYNLIMGESGFNSNAQNPTSTAYGMFQFLNSTWGSVGASKTSDPWGQTVAGLRYIANSYGSPLNAYSKWSARSPHWYEQGTPWVPNDQLAQLHKGEAVIPAEVNAARLRAGRSGGTQTVVLEFRSDGSPHMDWLIREFRKYVKINGGNVQQAIIGTSR